MMKKMLVAGLAALALAMAPQAASAAPFTGVVGYGGVWQLPDADGFDDEVQIGIVNALVLESSGAFAAAGINVGDFLVHATPLVYVPPTLPAGPMWTHVASGVSFILTSMTLHSVDDLSLELRGNGYFTGGGYEDTTGQWALTAQRASGNISQATYSADSVVPEPATLALLGFGLIGAGVARRRSRR